MLPKTIDQVVDRLEQILQQELAANRFTCLFTYIYMITTLAVKKGIEDEVFDDNKRMEKMDVIFANLYIQAYEDYHQGKPVSASWKRAFDHGNQHLTIIQHILLGMNAHINLDLAVAAAEVSQGFSIFDLEKDFNQINDILFSLTNTAEKKLGRVSPLFFLIGQFNTDADERLVNFSIEKAREQSWRSAVLLSHADAIMLPMLITQVDTAVSKIGKRIAKPKSFFFRKALSLVAKSEEQDLQIILNQLFE